MTGFQDIGDMAALSHVMHEFAGARSELRRLTDEISINSARRPVDLEKVKELNARLVERLDWLDILFEYQRIELNPSGIQFAPKGTLNIDGMFYRAIKHCAARMGKKEIVTDMNHGPSFAVEGYPMSIHRSDNSHRQRS